MLDGISQLYQSFNYMELAHFLVGSKNRTEKKEKKNTTLWKDLKQISNQILKRFTKFFYLWEVCLTIGIENFYRSQNRMFVPS